MKWILLLPLPLLLISCWGLYGNRDIISPMKHVWGNKPVYAQMDTAKKIVYDPVKHPVIAGGNIYAFNHYIFQVDVGRGIHVIDNTNPAQAERIGFITINGCEQVSIRGAYLYANSYNDLVTINIADPLHMQMVNRLPNTFPDLSTSYTLVQPEDAGYYECPRYDSVVVRWVKDSIYTNCYKY